MDGYVTSAGFVKQKKQDTVSTYYIIPLIWSFRKNK